MVVVDTSVALKWFLSEEGSERAEVLLRSDTLAAPDMLLYEITNVLNWRRDLNAEDRRSLLTRFLNCDVQMFVIPSHKFGRVVDLAQEFDITTYDASFIAMAEILETELVTADIKLLKKVRKLDYVRGL
jgi:predicted nucleic acid-binding protein